ncbi:MAG: hypothetical protein IH987_10990 [Planctomycetes bacterium]|nr:hypothetical protein [Planctomycetota bacterium]
MSIRIQLDDARSNLTEGRFVAAMVLYSIAIAAASRKRYPDKRDGDAFCTFVQDENRMLMPGGETLYIPGTEPKDPPGEIPEMTLATFLYKYIRCKIVHEAELPTHVTLSRKPFLIRVIGCWVELGDHFFAGLHRIVANAPEAN